MNLPHLCSHKSLRLLTETTAAYRVNRKPSVDVLIHICTECETLIAFDSDLLSKLFENELKPEQGKEINYWGKTGEWTMHDERHVWFDQEDLVYRYRRKKGT